MVRAKVEVFQITETKAHVTDPENPGKYKVVPRRVIEANIVQGSNDPEDKVFEYLSGGTTIKLATINAEAYNMFQVGKKYYVDFTPAD